MLARPNLRSGPDAGPMADAGLGESKPNYLVITAHDYRTPRRMTMHFIADELARRGTTRFFSLRYSALSRLRPDGRHRPACLIFAPDASAGGAADQIHR